MINDILCYHYYTWCQDKCPYQGVFKGILKREGNTFFFLQKHAILNDSMFRYTIIEKLLERQSQTCRKKSLGLPTNIGHLSPLKGTMRTSKGSIPSVAYTLPSIP